MKRSLNNDVECFEDIASSCTSCKCAEKKKMKIEKSLSYDLKKSGNSAFRSFDIKKNKLNRQKVEVLQQATQQQQLLKHDFTQNSQNAVVLEVGKTIPVFDSLSKSTILMPTPIRHSIILEKVPNQQYHSPIPSQVTHQQQYPSPSQYCNVADPVAVPPNAVPPNGKKVHASGFHSTSPVLATAASSQSDVNNSFFIHPNQQKSLDLELSFFSHYELALRRHQRMRLTKGPLAGASCHQCKVKQPLSCMVDCTAIRQQGCRLRRCRKKFCESCLRKYMNIEAVSRLFHDLNLMSSWACPSCLDKCSCARCIRIRSMS